MSAERLERAIVKRARRRAKHAWRAHFDATDRRQKNWPRVPNPFTLTSVTRDA